MKSSIHIVNKPSVKKVDERVEDSEDVLDQKLQIKFFDEHETELNQLGMLSGFDSVEKLLLDHSHLSCEHTHIFLSMKALNCAIERKHSEMNTVTTNCIILKHLLVFAERVNAISTNTFIIQTYFKKIRQADTMDLKLFTDELNDFSALNLKWAKEKRDEYMRDADEDGRAKRIADSLSGLDPQEVFDSLPEDMQEGVHSQNKDMMRDRAQTMDKEVILHHSQRCIDSGLWDPDYGMGKLGPENKEVSTMMQEIEPKLNMDTSEKERIKLDKKAILEQEDAFSSFGYRDPPP